MRDEGGPEEDKRPRPRVVDKRVSARPAEEPEEARGAREAREAPSGPEPSPPAAEPSPTAPVAAEPGAAAAGPEGRAGEPLWTPEQEEEAQALAQQLAEVSSRDWVVNTAVTLANVAAAKLDQGLAEDSNLAIDSLAALLQAVGPRLGEAEAPLRQTLAQLQLAYTQGIRPRPNPPG